MNDLMTLTVESWQTGSKKPLLPGRQVHLPSNWGVRSVAITLRQLIHHLVLDEVEAFQKRQSDQLLFRVLTARQIAAGKSAGRIDPAAKEYRQEVDAETAFETAIQAFVDGLYFVFVDGEQKEDLDEPILLQADSTLRFIRLMALAGG